MYIRISYCYIQILPNTFATQFQLGILEGIKSSDDVGILFPNASISLGHDPVDDMK